MFILTSSQVRLTVKRSNDILAADSWLISAYEAGILGLNSLPEVSANHIFFCVWHGNLPHSAQHQED